MKKYEGNMKKYKGNISKICGKYEEMCKLSPYTDAGTWKNEAPSEARFKSLYITLSLYIGLGLRKIPSSPPPNTGPWTFKSEAPSEVRC